MKRFVSEPLEPVDTGLDTAALSRAEPSLPGAFRWRGEEHRVAEIVLASRDIREEAFSGEHYLRRHTWKLRMEGGALWEVYFVRHAGAATAAKRGGPRWFLKTVDENPG
jgi:hypothetical protein